MCRWFTHMASWRKVHGFMNLIGPPGERTDAALRVASGQSMAVVRGAGRGAVAVDAAEEMRASRAL